MLVSCSSRHRLVGCARLAEFKTQATTLASLQHPNLCKLIGYYAKEDSNERMLVYERLYHGSLDKLLFGRSDGRFMDWSKRLKVALGAARGLAFLHDEGPFQAMYNEFSTLNIQIDKGFTAKLSGYGCVGFNTEEISNAPVQTIRWRPWRRVYSLPRATSGALESCYWS